MSLNLYVGPDSQPDKYRLVRVVGRGGEATLYLAQVSLAGQTEPVVVKVLNSDVTSNEEQFAELSARWSEQAELLRFINRLGVVGVREHFEGAPEHPAAGTVEGEGPADERALYLVMNYVDGLDLRDWRAENVVEGPRGRREVMRCLEQIAQVLDVLHSGRATPSKRVVVHGDLSPGNIMVSSEGQATLVDFGLSRIAARHMTARPWFTPGYAAPEIFDGEFSPATDRYAFGAIAYFALTGQDPPPAPEQLRARLAELPLVAEAEESRRALVMRMFSVDPAERPGASDWVRALRSLATSSVPWTAPTSDPAGFGDPGDPGDPGDALGAASLVSPAPGTAPEVPAEHDSGVEGADPPSGARFTGPPPVGASGPDIPPARSEDDGDRAAPEPRRPVGGMRGVPSARSGERRDDPPPGTAAPAHTGGNVPGPRLPPVPPPSQPSGPPVPPQPRDATGGARPGGPGGFPHTGPTSHPVSRPTPHHGSPGYGGPQATGPSAAPPPPPAARTSERPRRKSRTPLLVGLALFAVLFMVVGAGGTYVVMDRVLPSLTGDAEPDGTQLADTSTEASPAPSEQPDPTEAVGAGTSSPTPSEEASSEPEPTSVLITQMEPVEVSHGRWEPSAGRAEMNGEVYSRALLSTTCARCRGWSEYNLSRDWTLFTATIGVDDRSSSSGTVTLSVLVDGEPEVKETLRLGETMEIEVDVSDALRLRLEVDSSDDEVRPVWADPTLVAD
ncbi:protein kinase [Nocardiopsis sp. NPDC006938]|uniref:protein kinase domain-containing protein n=1 Tax=Nocardiopsis sp. NPDC006938 TaxID=3364337 RepID=UPI0036893805